MWDRFIVTLVILTAVVVAQVAIVKCGEIGAHSLRAIEDVRRAGR